MNNQNTDNTQAGTNCIDSNSNNKGVREMPYKADYATKKNLDHTRKELKSDIARLECNMNSKFEAINSQLNALTSIVHEANRKNERTLARLEQMDYERSYILDSIVQHNRKIMEIEKNKADRSEIIKLDN